MQVPLAKSDLTYTGPGIGELKLVASISILNNCLFCFCFQSAEVRNLLETQVKNNKLVAAVCAGMCIKYACKTKLIS